MPGRPDPGAAAARRRGRRPRGPVGELAEQLGISQSTCSHHVRKLADVGFVVARQGRHRDARVGQRRLLHGAAPRGRRRHGHARAAAVLPRGPSRRRHRPRAEPRRLADVPRHLRRGHRHPQRHLRDRGPRPSRPRPTRGCPTTDGSPRSTAGSSAGPPLEPVSPRRSTPASARPRSTSATATAAEASARRCIYRQVTAADTAGLWTLQTAIFPENRASIALHHSAGYRTLGVRERIGRHHGVLARHRLPRTAPRRLTSPAFTPPRVARGTRPSRRTAADRPLPDLLVKAAGRRDRPVLRGPRRMSSSVPRACRGRAPGGWPRSAGPRRACGRSPGWSTPRPARPSTSISRGVSPCRSVAGDSRARAVRPGGTSSGAARTVTRTCPSGACGPPTGQRKDEYTCPSRIRSRAAARTGERGASSASACRPGSAWQPPSARSTTPAVAARTRRAAVSSERIGSMPCASTGASRPSRRRVAGDGGCRLPDSSARKPTCRPAGANRARAQPLVDPGRDQALGPGRKLLGRVGQVRGAQRRTGPVGRR